MTKHARPAVHIDRPNQAPALRQHLVDLLPQLTVLPGVVGITLNGGIARGYADHLSEVDLTLYLEAATYRQWREQRSPLAHGITVIAGQIYDVKVLDFAAETAATWSSDALWDASYAEILYDPAGLIRHLFDSKLAQRPALDALGGLMMSCWWYYRLAGDIWIHRGDVLQGHALFNQAVVVLARALFAANQEWIPHEKWLLHMSRSLAWTPDGWERRLQAAMSTGDFTVASLGQRQAAIDSLWHAIDAHVRSTWCPGLPVALMQKSFYDLLLWLGSAETIPLTEWKAAGGESLLNLDPFHAVARIEGDTLVLDRARLLALEPDEMYAWHFAVLDAVRQS